MSMNIDQLNAAHLPSEDIIAREIDGKLIIVPLTAGFSDMENERYTFNNADRKIWKLLDGQQTLSDVVGIPAETYSAPAGGIKEDVVGLVGGLVDRHILIEAPHG